jgi:SHS2 domain-containing protein
MHRRHSLRSWADEGPDIERAVRVEAADLPALLVAWLTELVCLAEGESLVAIAVDTLRIDGTVADGTVKARRGRARYLVKAVTHHGLACEPQDGGWRAMVVFDV